MSYFMRVLIALLLVSGWMVLLFSGWTLGGTIHALLVAALVLFPWRQLPGPTDDEPGG